MHTTNRKLGPSGSNLFLFHLPNNMKDSDLFNLFRRFGNIYSTRVMTEKNGKSKGIGFVSFDNPKSAQDAIEEMNGFEVRGKRLKVELNKKDEKAITNNVSSLNQASFDF
jgi:CUG-BP- and ETR3-like factor